MRRLFICFCLICLSSNIHAQEKKVVAIMPFLSAVTENRKYAAMLQSIATQTFTANTNVQFVDRSADPLVMAELENQTREQSISSTTLVQQGKLAGAQELIVGTLSTVGIESQQVSGFSGYSTKYIANISFSLQKIDAATGLVISSKDFNGNTHTTNSAGKILRNQGGILGEVGKAANELLADTKDEAIRKAVNGTKKKMLDWIYEVYQPDIRIIKIDTRDSKGFPEYVWISGFGSNMSSGKKISIKETVMVDDGRGGKLSMESKIAELKVSEIKGQVTVCKVKRGEDVLEEKMKGPGTLTFIVD